LELLPSCDSLNAFLQIEVPVKNSFSDRVKRSIGPFILVSALGLIAIAAEAVAAVIFGAITLYLINGHLQRLATQSHLSYCLLGCQRYCSPSFTRRYRKQEFSGKT
jgi:hypothetical protein